MPQNRISLKLLELRQQHNLTQKQLCENLNISRSVYSILNVVEGYPI